MNQSLNLERLRELLSCLEHLRGIQCSIYQLDGTWINASQDCVPFCRMICSTAEGADRCRECRRQVLQEAWEKRSICRCQCHAGIFNYAIPVEANGQVEAVILFYCLSGDMPFKGQWQSTQEKISWLKEKETLKAAFEGLPRLSEREMAACRELVYACVHESSEERRLSAARQSDMERLRQYIQEHYTQHLTLDSIGEALEISKSRLCAIAAAGGTTVGRILTEKRMEAAKTLLSSGDTPIRRVAGQVGISDYNYFTKVFRKTVGYTPREFRNSWRQRKETLDNS